MTYLLAAYRLVGVILSSKIHTPTRDVTRMSLRKLSPVHPCPFHAHEKVSLNARLSHRQVFHSIKRARFCQWFSVLTGMKVLLLALGLLVSLASCTEFHFKHHDNDELVQVLERINADCPNITRLYTLSESSVSGRPLYVIEFSTKPGHHELCKYYLF